MWTRRQLLFGSAALALCPQMSFAKSPRAANNFVLVLLRGGLDGLAAVVPHGDPDYERARGTLATSRSEIIDLDGYFGLHPALGTLERFWERQELLFVHALASPYRSRSHFDAQKILENGTGAVHNDDSGWLNRALGAIPAAPHAPVAIGRGVPLVLRGSASTTAIDPVRNRKKGFSFVEEVQELYAGHPSLEEALQQHLISQGLIEAAAMNAMNHSDDRSLIGTERTGALLKSTDGPNIAVLELRGFDTHIRQGTTNGALANRLRGLGDALSALAAALGSSWERTVVTVVSEFGRTVAPNGSGGTDHGTASVAMVLGGAVRGGRVIADWPGLSPSDLQDGRDLRPTTDTRALFSGLLHEHMGVPHDFLTTTVFPDAPDSLLGLVRS